MRHCVKCNKELDSNVFACNTCWNIINTNISSYLIPSHIPKKQYSKYIIKLFEVNKYEII